MSWKTFLLCFVVFNWGRYTQAQTDNSVQQTQEMLRNNQARQQMLNSPEAKNAAQQIDIITKGNLQQKDEIYNLSADLFPNLATQGNADPAKMNAILIQAMQNPESFYNTWTPQQKADFQRIVHEMEASQANKPAHP